MGSIAVSSASGNAELVTDRVCVRVAPVADLAVDPIEAFDLGQESVAPVIKMMAVVSESPLLDHSTPDGIIPLLVPVNQSSCPKIGV